MLFLYLNTNTIENKINGMRMEMKIKRANYIEKSNTINPEFSYTHPRTKNEVNLICNNHFTGGQLWDLFSRDADMVYNTQNKSVLLKFDVPLQTHRYFLEHLAKTRQLKLGQFTMMSQQIRLILVDCLKVEN